MVFGRKQSETTQRQEQAEQEGLAACAALRGCRERAARPVAMTGERPAQQQTAGESRTGRFEVDLLEDWCKP